MIKISVVIPLYNKELTILRAVKSVLNQTFLPNEIIIVNDGSTDRSIEYLERIKNPKIKILHQDNKGVSAARNLGIDSATSEFIAFLDADDEWSPQFLNEIQSLILNFPEAVGYATSYNKKSSSNNLISTKLEKIKFTGDQGFLTNYFEVCNQSDPPIWTSAVCIKKVFLIKINRFPIGVKAGEDLLTWAKLSVLGNFAYSKKSLATYYLSEFNPSMTVSLDKDFVSIELNKLKGVVAEVNEFKKYLGKWHKMRASLFLITGQRLMAYKEIYTSIILSGFSIKLGLYALLPFFPKKLIFKILFRQ